MPNLAIIAELKNFDRIYYIGSKNGAERKIIEKTGITYFPITSAKFSRSFAFSNFLIPIKLFYAIIQAKHILKNLKPNVVFSKGGYVSLPVVIAAHSLGIPVYSHESDLSLGLANKIASRYCLKVFTSFPETALLLKNGYYSGSPIRKELLASKRKKIVFPNGSDPDKPVLIVIGGSSGARAVNSAVRAAKEKLVEYFNVIHICGKGNAQNIKLKGFYEIEFSDNIGELFASSDFAVSRGGSNTVFELLAMKIPSLIIPLPKGNSRGDQVENAEYFRKKNLIEVLEENNITANNFVSSVLELKADGEILKSKLKNCNFNGASEKIAAFLNFYAK